MGGKFALGSSGGALRIAGITIGLETDDPALSLRAGGAAAGFVVEDAAPEVRVRARWGEPEEERGEPAFDSGGLWRLFRDEDGCRIQFTSEALGPRPYKVASFREDFARGEVRVSREALGRSRPVDPLEYPLDELLVTNLLALGRGMEVHALGLITLRGAGLLFAGPSGAGKSTLAGLWGPRAAEVLSDDRIILRQEGGWMWMHGTPWHGEGRFSSPGRAPLERILFLRHGPRNRIVPLGAVEAAARLFATSFPPFHSARGIEFTLEFCESAARAVPCGVLEFVPGAAVVDLVCGV